MFKHSPSQLSKRWTPKFANQPFHCGNKLFFAADESELYTILPSSYVGSMSIENPSAVKSWEFGECNCLCVLPNGDDVIVARQHLLSHWKLSTGLCVRSFRGHTMPVLSIACSKTGTMMVSGSSDGIVKIWDIERGFCTHSFKEKSGSIRSVYFHPEALMVFSIGSDNTVVVYDLPSKRTLVRFDIHSGMPTKLEIHVSSNTLVSTGRDKIMCFYDLNRFELTKTVPSFEELVDVVVFNNVHSSLLCGCQIDSLSLVGVTSTSCGKLKFWVYEQGKRLFKSLFEFCLEKFASVTVHSILYLPVRGSIAVCCDDCIAFYKVDEIASMRENSAPFQRIVSNLGDILDMAVINAKQPGLDYKVAFATNSRRIHVVNNNITTSVLDGHNSVVLSVDISPDGVWLVSSSKDSTCMVWNLVNEKCTAVCVGHTDAVGAVCISSCQSTYTSRASFIVSGGADKVLKRWNFLVDNLHQRSPVSLSASHSVRAHDKDINCVCTSPNDDMIASASHDKTVKLWSSADLNCIAILRGHKRGVWKVAFSPVDKILASCSGDKTVKIWSVVDYSLLRSFDGHSGSVLSIAFVCLGHQLVSGSSDGLIRLWTVRSGECVNTFDSHSDKVWTIRPNNNGCFFSGGCNSQFILWENVTADDELREIASIEHKLTTEQALNSFLVSGQYIKAMSSALQLQPSKVLTVLNVCVANSRGDMGQLDALLQKLEPSELQLLCSLVCEWNSISRLTYVCQAFLDSLFRSFPVSFVVESLGSSAAGILAYSQRHYQRLDRLGVASSMLDYVVLASEDSSNRPAKRKC